ncbi:hypothetical protein [Neotabrizicola sp. sgz301269]|uniref:hypothetical protein n=1 Tax=Neotabrizicola sp. sgz301269 TaxID=3276282 RepID=UPI00376FF1E8
MVSLFTMWVSGAIPILLIAWLGRKIFRAQLTPVSTVVSVAVAGVIAFFVRGFAEGEGGYSARIDNMLSAEQLPIVWPQVLLALSLSLFVGWHSMALKRKP